MTAVKEKKLSPSLEDYIEAVLYLVRKGRVARVRDIAKRLNVGMPSVTVALKTLSQRKLVNYDPYQVITLTDRGREIAEEISRRHVLLRRFLTEVLGLDAERAEANACRMEHAADAVLLERLGRFVEFIRRCPRVGDEWVRRFLQFCRAGPEPDRCRACLKELQERLDGLEGSQP